VSGPDSSSPATIPLAAVLELMAMQLEVAMQNAAAQAERLSGSVAELAIVGGKLGARLRASEDPELAAQIRTLEAEANRAMVAMQFHDQLAQRLNHVRDALGDVHDELVAGGTPDWSALVRKMRGHYTMEDERRLFDMVLGEPDAAGKRGEEALPSSVELF
jgi:hypothetical protein